MVKLKYYGNVRQLDGPVILFLLLSDVREMNNEYFRFEYR